MSITEEIEQAKKWLNSLTVDQRIVLKTKYDEKYFVGLDKRALEIYKKEKQ